MIINITLIYLRAQTRTVLVQILFMQWVYMMHSGAALYRVSITLPPVSWQQFWWRTDYIKGLQSLLLCATCSFCVQECFSSRSCSIRLPQHPPLPSCPHRRVHVTKQYWRRGRLMAWRNAGMEAVYGRPTTPTSHLFQVITTGEPASSAQINQDMQNAWKSANLGCAGSHLYARTDVLYDLGEILF